MRVRQVHGGPLGNVELIIARGALGIGRVSAQEILNAAWWVSQPIPMRGVRESPSRLQARCRQRLARSAGGQTRSDFASYALSLRRVRLPAGGT